MAWYRCVGGAGGSLKLRTASGRIATFNTNMVEPFKSLKSDINPVQDLHGYSKPWSGGAGKNKLDYLSHLRTTSEGMTISATSGGAIHYQGTATTNYSILTTAFNLSIPSGTTITVSRDVSLGYQHYFDLTYTDNSVEYVRIMPNTTSTTYTLPKDLKNIDIVCLGLAVGTAYNATVKFQLEYGSQATSWESYSNICPISGFSNSVIRRTGKNLLGGEELADGFANTYQFSKDTTNKTFNFVRAVSAPYKDTVISGIFKADTVYTFYFTYTAAANNTSLLVLYTDGTTSAIGFNATNTKTKRIFTTATDKTVQEVYLSFYSVGVVTAYYDECGVFEGAITETDFEPYAGSKYQKYFKGLMNGTYNVVELGSLNWQKNGVNRFTATQPTNDIKAPAQTVVANIICNKYQSASFGDAYAEDKDKVIAININKHINIVDKAYTDATAFKNSLDGVYLIYELETATTPTITQSEIDTLITAFNADLITVIFNQTVYGGVADVTNGKVNVAYAKKKINELTWNYVNIAGSERFYSTSLSTVIEKPTTIDIVSTLKCSCYETVSERQYAQFTSNNIIAVQTTGFVVIRDTNYTSVSDLLNAVGEQEICYPLATPIEITTTPENLTAISGVNNVYGDTNGDTGVKYLYRG